MTCSSTRRSSPNKILKEVSCFFEVVTSHRNKGLVLHYAEFLLKTKTLNLVLYKFLNTNLSYIKYMANL